MTTTARPNTAKSIVVRLVALDTSTLVFVVLVAVLAVLIGAPLVSLIVNSFVPESGAGWTLEHYRTAFTSARFRLAGQNSLVLAASVAAIGTVVGTLMAWGIAKTDLPLKNFIRVLVLGSLITPPYLGATAWVFLAGPNAGHLNRLFASITGADQPLFNIFSMPGLIFVVFLYTFPFAFVAVTAALELVSDDVEDAARLLGASFWTANRQIVIPLALPAILASAILIFLEAIALFGSPAILAIPGRFHVLTTQIYQLFQYPPRDELASAVAMPLLLVTTFLLFLQRRLLGRRGYASVGGRAGQRRVTSLGSWKWPLLMLCLLVVTMSMILPYGQLLVSALSKTWTQPPSLDNLSVEHFRWILVDYAGGKLALGNSVFLGVLTATIGAVAAAIIAYIVNRRLLPGSRLLAFAVMAPIVIPSIVLGVGIFTVYARPPVMLYGTLWILFLAYLIKFLPLAFTNTDSSIKSIHADLEDAARILGAGRLKAYWDITVPLIKSGVLAAWVLLFIAAIREFSSSALLYTAPTRVLSVEIYELYSSGSLESASALGILLFLLSIGVVAIAYRLLGKNFMGVRE